MSSKELRENFLNFFARRGHTIVQSSSLIPTDPSVLFTTAGMQQFKRYYLGEKSPYNNKVATCQKCFRTSDIEEVGDEKHLTFLEMLGNFSFGDYFKKEAIEFAYEFLFKELKLSPKNFYVTVFEGDKNVPFDEESFLIWQKIGIPKDKIKKKPRSDNFWGPTDKEGPCGPTTEIHINDVEVWNLVFNEYYQNENGELSPLVQKGVDTGMGLERLAMISQGKPNVFETDLFEPILKKIPISAGNERSKRIIADHIKSAVFLAAEGITPSNIERGYVLRKLLRRVIRYGKLLNFKEEFLISLAKEVIGIYKNIYPEVKRNETDILTVIQNEEEKFSKTLDKGLKFLKDNIESYKTFDKAAKEEYGKELPFKGGFAFYMYETYGFPPELTLEELKKDPQISKKITEDEFWNHFNKRLAEHQEISRAGAEKKFGGVGKEAGYETARLHTATHLLHSALRKILGEHVKQMGSDITPVRLRFDFSHNQKMSSEELEQVEDLVNQKIKEDLIIKKEEMSLKNALESGALAFFKEKYPETVSVYSIFNSKTGEIFSKEICAGPHVDKTSELAHFKIIKEESSGANIRRIKAII